MELGQSLPLINKPAKFSLYNPSARGHSLAWWSMTDEKREAVLDGFINRRISARKAEQDQYPVSFLGVRFIPFTGEWVPPIFPSRQTPRVSARIEVYPKDSRLIRERHRMQTKGKGGGIRGEITELSKASRTRMMFAFRNVSRALPYMVTLTYPAEFPCDGDIVKKHWRAFREWLRRRNVKFAWFLEFQRRGAPHIHLFTSAWVDPKSVSRAWYKIVASGDERHLLAGTRCEVLRNPEAAGAYASKYATKTDQKEVPEGYRNVGRFWGMSRDVRPRCLPVSGFCDQHGDTMTRAVRVFRALVNAKRREWGKGPIKDNGCYSFIAWGCGAGVLHPGSV